MILFLHGEDTYRSRQKLEEIRAKFLRDIDPSGLNVAVVDGEKAEIPDIRAAIASAPFLAKKRLVILKNAIRETKKSDEETLAGVFDSVPEDTILTVFEESGGEDLKASAAFQKIRGGKFYPEFALLDAKSVSAWIVQEAKKRGAEFDRAALNLYAAAAGNDLWKISSELDQFAANAAEKPIGVATVRALSHARMEENIFEFLDAVGLRKTDRAAKILEGLFEQGETETAILNRLQSHLRSLLVCADLGAAGQITKDRIVREIGLHPFVAGKILMQTRYFSLEELKRLYRWLIDADRRLKTGGWPSPRMAVDLFLLELIKTPVAP